MIPKKIMKDNKIYVFVKQYPYVLLYEEEKTGIKECFNKCDLGLIKNNKNIRNKPVLKDKHGEKID